MNSTDTTYHAARLTGSPPRRTITPSPAHQQHQQDAAQITIQVPPLSSGLGLGGQQPIPINLPNIFVNPFPPLAAPPPPPVTTPNGLPVADTPPPTPGPRRSFNCSLSTPGKRFRMSRPHPLLWLTLALSILAIVLGVPKGTLPTLTGRHRALRAQEIAVAERLALLTQLAVFLPAPLAALIAPDSGNGFFSNAAGTPRHRRALEMMRLGAGLRFWNGNGYGDDGTRWWSVEELGDGASIVRARTDGREREVWILRAGEGSAENEPLLVALSNSLMSRERIQNDLDICRATTCPVCPVQAVSPRIVSTSSFGVGGEDEYDAAERREEWEQLEARRRRDREREREVEEREHEVGRREKWVVDEMRKLSDKVHTQATELTLEDKITERLKAYQRQMAHIQEVESNGV